ncbi:MAG: hypothetical protein QNJ00_00780 [Woeseiaceae bacterium]|nr:hypothetical protein [Woeseiaceae bacterium]
MKRSTLNHQLFAYYAATVLFVVLDVLLDINIRLSFLADAPVWRGVYYAFCIACAVVMRWRPDLSVFIGAVEGLITIIGLIFSMYLGHTLAGAKDMGDVAQLVLNYAISGYFAYMSWRRGLMALGAHS